MSYEIDLAFFCCKKTSFGTAWGGVIVAIRGTPCFSHDPSKYLYSFSII